MTRSALIVILVGCLIIGGMVYWAFSGIAAPNTSSRSFSLNSSGNTQTPAGTKSSQPSPTSPASKASPTPAPSPTPKPIPSVLPSPTPTVATNNLFAWNASSPPFSQQQQHQLESALAAELGNQVIDHQLVYYGIDQINEQQNWATFGLDQRLGSLSSQPISQTLVFVLGEQNQNGAWQVWVPADPEFCIQISAAPSSLVSQAQSEFCS